MYKINYSIVNKEDPAFIQQLINSDCNTLITFTLSLFRGLITNGLSMIWITLVIYYNSPSLLIGSLILIFLNLVLYLAFKKNFYKYGLLVKNSQATYFSGLYNLTAKLKSIKLNSFGNISFSNQATKYVKYLNSLNRQLSLTNLNYSLSSMIYLAANILIFMYGGFLVFEGRISLGILVITSNYFMTLVSSADYFFNFGIEIQDAKVSYDRLKKFIKIEDREEENITFGIISSIKVKNLCLTQTLSNAVVNIIFEKGKLYWIKGKNGSGKSTFINTILGLYENDFSGSIFVNDIDFNIINKYEYLSNNVSIVEQVPFLLGCSFKENLLIKSVNVKDDKLNYYIENFNLIDFFQKKSAGIDTIYDNTLETLSVGEKQKLAIIRTFLSSSDVLIFDEPTSALDYNSTHFFYDEVNKIKQDKIVIIISHDNILNYDELIELNYFTKF